MSQKQINHLIQNEKLWILLSAFVLLLYLSPLLFMNGDFYIPTFDNLDSTIVWYKILAESGMIFADNNATIPNMMNGLPRSSYPGEFNILLWLYYFFTPLQAFIINKIIIHLVAFFSMLTFLKSYFTKEIEDNYITLYLGSLYFATIPYWSGAGLSIAILPLVTFSLLRIKDNKSNSFDWLLLLLLPLYTSFIFLYAMYVGLVFIYILYALLKQKTFYKKLFIATTFLSSVFLLTEYRLVLTMFFDPAFISHREEFNIFFQKSLFETFRSFQLSVIDGHKEHATALQSFYVIPVLLLTLLLSHKEETYPVKESLVIYVMFFLMIFLDIFTNIIGGKYFIPLLLILLLVALYKKKNIVLIKLVSIILVLSFIARILEYSKFAFIEDIFPILAKFNMNRIAFVEPFLWALTFTLSISLLHKKLRYFHITIVILFLVQLSVNIKYNYFSATKKLGYTTFSKYYTPEMFTQIKQDFSQENIKLSDIKVANLVFEPAIALYNGFYTVDGYAVNYPLEYKHKFRKIIEKHLNQYEVKKVDPSRKNHRFIFDNWGSKLYILNASSQHDSYIKGAKFKKLDINTLALCNLNANYIFSGYAIVEKEKLHLELKKKYTSTKYNRNIYVYQLDCR